MIAKRLLQLLTVFLVLPLTAAVVGRAYAKGRVPKAPGVSEKAAFVAQCAKDLSAEVGKQEALTLNQACTCFGDRVGYRSSLLKAMLKQRSSSKELGRCLFLAKDGL
ncbi:MAG TPA: hypothetical protein VFV50_16800 [Bdellovibrionales bacterium]|nr:hypothetical protein [Bdellovibrionales bacterium]